MPNRLNPWKPLFFVTTSAACVSLGGVDNARSATLIDTTSSWNGTDSAGPFGEPSTATYGQTFTVGSDNFLHSFTFYLDDDNTKPDTVDFAAYVMAWDNITKRATGAILYQSDPRSTTKATGFEEFTFNPGGINLTTGLQYVAFLNASKFFDTSAGTAKAARVFTDAYTGGSFVFLNNGTNFNALTTNSWSSNANDLAVKISLSSKAPEPLTIVGTLIGGATALWMRKKLKSDRQV